MPFSVVHSGEVFFQLSWFVWGAEIPSAAVLLVVPQPWCFLQGHTCIETLLFLFCTLLPVCASPAAPCRWRVGDDPPCAAEGQGCWLLLLGSSLKLCRGNQGLQLLRGTFSALCFSVAAIRRLRVSYARGRSSFSPGSAEVGWSC